MKTVLTLLVLIKLFTPYMAQSMFVSIVDPNELKTINQAVKEVTHEDICANIECEAGERCIVSDNKPLCECYEDCQIPNDQRLKICSTSNKTFESDCHFLRQKCWCNKNDQKCADFSIVSDKLDYYGACTNINQCTQNERRIFVERMKVWLDEVLHVLDNRQDLDSKFLYLVKLADELKAKKVEKYWTAGVIFEFCKLDSSKDHSIQKEEIALLVSSIKSMEHCIQPFLDETDSNEDGIISEDEWGTALDLSDDDLSILRQYC